MRYRFRSRGVTCGIAIAAVAACSRAVPAEPPSVPAVRIETATLQREATGGARYSASIEPRARVDVAFKAAGYVETIAAVGGHALQEGDPVARGFVLARLRDAEYQQKSVQAQAQQTQADAALTQTRTALDRATALRAARGLTLPEFEAAQNAFDAAKARATVTRAIAAEAQMALDDTILRAPMDGVVLKRLVEPGTLVGPGTPAVALADISEVRVAFGATDVLLPKLARGSVQIVTTEAYPGEEFPGRITSIAPNADPRSRVFDVRIAVPNRGGRLKPGMVAALRVHQDAAAGAATVLVPLGAIVRAPNRPDAYAVFLVEGAGDGARARLREVTLGEAVGNRLSILSGLAPGDKVIVQGATLVTDGERVSVLP
jgi:RND family efflux transporter MFP subunit